MTEQARKVVRGDAGRPRSGGVPPFVRADRPHPVLMVLLAVAGAVLGQFAIELGAGRVPVPAGYTWLIPIANAGLVVLVAHLPSPASRGSRLPS